MKSQIHYIHCLKAFAKFNCFQLILNFVKFFTFWNMMWIDSENINIFISAAILITGGKYGAEWSAEVFLPWSNTTCQLPSLLNKRYAHVQAGRVLCGGRSIAARRNCVQWSVQQANWTELPLTLSWARQGASVWARGDQLIIMGGVKGAEETSERVSSDGAVSRSSFVMKYKTR